MMIDEVFTHRSLYPEKSLHSSAFTLRRLLQTEDHRSFYTGKSLHGEIFVYTGELLHTDFFNAQEFLHTGVLTHRSSYTQKPIIQRGFYTQNFTHTEAFPEGSLDNSF